ncbi:MAG: universal stress protein [Polyangiales bacterium]
MSETNENKESAAPFRVVVGMDMEAAGEAALYEALRLARFGTEEHLHLVHVLSTPGAARTERALQELDARLEAAPAKFRDYLIALSERMPQTGARAVTLHVRAGVASTELHQVAIDVNADLIVVGTHNRQGLAKMLLGNTAQDLLQIAHCPVMVVRPKDFSVDQPTEAPDPACADCVAARKASGGEALWCEFHSRPRVRVHGVASSEVFSFGAHGAGIQTGGL